MGDSSRRNWIEKTQLGLFPYLNAIVIDSAFQERLIEDNLRGIYNALDLAESFIWPINTVRHFPN